MQVKLKSANGITRFLLAHGEKLGIVAIGALAGMLIWNSLGRERLEATKQPGNLSTKADSAQNHFMGMSWQRIKETEPAEVVDAAVFRATAGDGVMTPVNEGDFPTLPPLNPRIVDAMALRTDPQLLPLKELEVNSSSGLWAMADPEVTKRMLAQLQKQQEEARLAEEERAAMAEGEERGGRRGRRGRGRDEMGEMAARDFGSGSMTGLNLTDDGVAVMQTTAGAQTQGFEAIVNRSWVTVLAKVPIAEQVEQYQDALQYARGYNQTTDMPEYMGYIVQRKEIFDDGESEWQTLPNVGKRTIINALEQRPIETPEVINPKYNHSLLTFPLPPMVLRPWGEDVTHSDLPLPSPDDMYNLEEMQGLPKDDLDDVGEDGDDFAKQLERDAKRNTGGMYAGPEGRFGGEMGGPMGRFGGPMGGPMGRFGGEMGETMGRGAGMGRMGGFGGEMMGGMGGYGQMGRGAGGYEALEDYVWDGQKFILFRYFDSTVKPGHRYRYRVQLVLRDVNKSSTTNMIPESYLDPTVTARMQEENLGYRKTEWSEPSRIANVPQPGLIYVAQVKPATNPAAEPTARLLVKSLDAAHAAEIAIGDWFARGSVVNVMRRKADVIWSGTYDLSDEKNRQSPEFDFVTALTLLDFTGGEALNRNRALPAPARALVMDSAGRMSVRAELNDKLPIREYETIVEESKRAMRDRNDRDGGRGGRGEMGGRR